MCDSDSTVCDSDFSPWLARTSTCTPLAVKLFVASEECAAKTDVVVQAVRPIAARVIMVDFLGSFTVSPFRVTTYPLR